MGIQAKDIMTGNVIVVDESMHAGFLVELFDQNNITAAPVVDNNKKLVGIVTKSDVLGYYIDLNIKVNLRKNLTGLIDFDLSESDYDAMPDPDATVATIMTPGPITASESTSLEKLAQIMLEKHIHKIIIMKKKKITGIVSPIDFLHHIAGVKKNAK